MNQPYMYIYHNFLFSGWVQTVEYHDLGPDFTSCLLNAKVKPSQRLSDKPHEPWVATWKKKIRNDNYSSLLVYGRVGTN